MFYGHFCARDRLNGTGEVKDETPLRCTHAEIRTQAVVICGPTRYQLDHGGTLGVFKSKPTRIVILLPQLLISNWMRQIEPEGAGMIINTRNEREDNAQHGSDPVIVVSFDHHLKRT